MNGEGTTTALEDSIKALELDPCNWKAVHHQIQALLLLKRPAIAQDVASNALSSLAMPQAETKAILQLQQSAKAAAAREPMLPDSLTPSDEPSFSCKTPSKHSPAYIVFHCHQLMHTKSQSASQASSTISPSDYVKASDGALLVEAGQRGCKARIDESSLEGRHLVAAADISADSDILSEEAQFAVLNRRHRKEVKYRLCSILLTAIDLQAFICSLVNALDQKLNTILGCVRCLIARLSCAKPRLSFNHSIACCSVAGGASQN